MNDPALCCLDCEEVFYEEEAWAHTETEPTEFWGDTTPQKVTVLSCPFCGGDQLEEVTMCEKCALRKIKAGEDWCEECLGKHVRSLEPLDQWMTDFRDELNGMLPR